MNSTIDCVRQFNRTWTEVLGLLDQGLLETEHSLAESRVIFELAQQPSWERQALRERLGMDASFLTRVLNRLQNKELVSASPSDLDGRAINLALTPEGQTAFRQLDKRSAAQIAALIEPLNGDQQAKLRESMTVLAHLVGSGSVYVKPLLRELATGDMGWVIGRHGTIYHQEYGWDATFEALVASIVADFASGFKPGREQAWIAEVDGARAGCVFCCERDKSIAQLRILLVEPWARGMGIGNLLVNTCIEFARNAGYDALTLWTNDVLTSARKIYQAAGFTLLNEAQHRSFGHDLVGQHWQLQLRDDVNSGG